MPAATATGWVWTESEWTAKRDDHHARLNPIVQPHLHRASLGQRHPIIDFLFQYYPFSPAQLLRWTPGLGITLAGDLPEELLHLKAGTKTTEGWRVTLDTFPARRRGAVSGILSLLEITAERPPRFGCFGLHEWAMIYRSDDVRHPQLPLRYSLDESARIVDSLPVACSHYDAFRFFTPAAGPVNRLQPTRENQRDLEQRGCLHANMDLYKWAQQFYPWIDSALIADCFLLAVEIRHVDMRASPYDVSAYGHAPIPIETSEGRREYVDHQTAFAEKAQPLRHRLIKAFRRLRDALDQSHNL